MLVTDGITDRLATDDDRLGQRALCERLGARAAWRGEHLRRAARREARATEDATVLVLEMPRRHRRATPVARAGLIPRARLLCARDETRAGGDRGRALAGGRRRRARPCPPADHQFGEIPYPGAGADGADLTWRLRIRSVDLARLLGDRIPAGAQSPARRTARRGRPGPVARRTSARPAPRRSFDPTTPAGARADLRLRRAVRLRPRRADAAPPLRPLLRSRSVPRQLYAPRAGRGGDRRTSRPTPPRRRSCSTTWRTRSRSTSSSPSRSGEAPSPTCGSASRTS